MEEKEVHDHKLDIIPYAVIDGEIKYKSQAVAPGGTTLAEMDKRGVRAFVRYSEASGKWGIEVYRKKTDAELTSFQHKLNESYAGDLSWKMIRTGSTQTYFTRQEAEVGALELAESVAKEFGF